MVSILKTVDKQFTFPLPRKLNLRLKDMLEDEVDEKYYINNEKAQKLICTLYDRGQLQTGGVDLSIKKTKNIDVANCILARTDCGISNQQSIGTGVIENV